MPEIPEKDSERRRKGGALISKRGVRSCRLAHLAQADAASSPAVHAEQIVYGRDPRGLADRKIAAPMLTFTPPITNTGARRLPLAETEDEPSGNPRLILAIIGELGTDVVHLD